MQFWEMGSEISTTAGAYTVSATELHLLGRHAAELPAVKKALFSLECLSACSLERLAQGFPALKTFSN